MQFIKPRWRRLSRGRRVDGGGPARRGEARKRTALPTPESSSTSRWAERAAGHGHQDPGGRDPPHGGAPERLLAKHTGSRWRRIARIREGLLHVAEQAKTYGIIDQRGREARRGLKPAGGLTEAPLDPEMSTTRRTCWSAPSAERRKTRFASSSRAHGLHLRRVRRAVQRHHLRGVRVRGEPRGEASPPPEALRDQRRRSTIT